jgi:hypothetical protein
MANMTVYTGGNINHRVINTDVVEDTQYIIFTVNHKNPDIKAIYEEFKEQSNRVEWLSANRSRLEKFDMNVDALIAAQQKIEHGE